MCCVVFDIGEYTSFELTMQHPRLCAILVGCLFNMPCLVWHLFWINERWNYNTLGFGDVAWGGSTVWGPGCFLVRVCDRGRINLGSNTVATNNNNNTEYRCLGYLFCGCSMSGSVLMFAIISCCWKRVVKITLPRFAVSYLFCAVDRCTTNTRCFVLGVYSVFQW